MNANCFVYSILQWNKAAKTEQNEKTLDSKCQYEITKNASGTT